jgi:hypothetical protein
MDMNERQIALHVLESLREDLVFAHLNNGRPLLFVADLRQYIYEQMGRLRANALVTDRLDASDDGPGQTISTSHSNDGKAHPLGKTLAKAAGGSSEAGHG